jgi:hypothetical protein
MLQPRFTTAFSEAQVRDRTIIGQNEAQEDTTFESTG